MKHILVVGAGPKAMAIAAKVKELKKIGLNVPKVTIVERKHVGAHWDGSSGYTNGDLPLGTSPEKDVAFPYSSELVGESNAVKLSEKMYEYSWNSYLVRDGLLSDWVDRGRPAPTHKDWAKYLQFVFEKTRDVVELVKAEVVSSRIQGEQWAVDLKNEEFTETILADGLVFTGPGTPTHNFEVSGQPHFYTMLDYFRTLDQRDEFHQKEVIVVGNGENAASMIHAMSVRGIEPKKLIVVSPTGGLSTRSEGYFENRIFSKPEKNGWYELDHCRRRDFIRKTDLGVFSPAVISIAQQFNIEIKKGWLKEIREDDDRGVQALISDGDSVKKVSADVLVLANGFSQTHSTEKLIESKAREEILRLNNLSKWSYQSLASKINHHLAVENVKPYLHLPMISALNQGPGFPNLSCLGRFSDRIISAYL